MLCSSQNILWVSKSRLRWTGYVARMVDIRNSYEILVGEPEGKKSQGTQGRYRQR